MQIAEEVFKMKKNKSRWEREKKYIEEILLGDAGKASRRVACKRALVLNGNTICKKLLTRQLGGRKE